MRRLVKKEQNSSEAVRLSEKNKLKCDASRVWGHKRTLVSSHLLAVRSKYRIFVIF